MTLGAITFNTEGQIDDKSPGFTQSEGDVSFDGNITPFRRHLR